MNKITIIAALTVLSQLLTIQTFAQTDLRFGLSFRSDDGFNVDLLAVIDGDYLSADPANILNVNTSFSFNDGIFINNGFKDLTYFIQTPAHDPFSFTPTQVITDFQLTYSNELSLSLDLLNETYIFTNSFLVGGSNTELLNTSINTFELASYNLDFTQTPPTVTRSVLSNGTLNDNITFQGILANPPAIPEISSTAFIMSLFLFIFCAYRVKRRKYSSM